MSNFYAEQAKSAANEYNKIFCGVEQITVKGSDDDLMVIIENYEWNQQTVFSGCRFGCRVVENIRAYAESQDMDVFAKNFFPPCVGPLQ